MPMWLSFGFQDSASLVMKEMVLLHDHVMIILSLVVILTLAIFISFFLNKSVDLYVSDNQWLESIWTVFPALLLIFIALPSLRLLYLTDEIYEPLLTIKVVGHQWYWSYEYSDFIDIGYDSYMIPEDVYSLDNFRLLDVDNHMVIPMKSCIRALVTGSDVIHSWTLPSLGLKVDAVPGRLNQLTMYCDRSGLFYGQCSEICGMNHSFMPIVIESVSINGFLSWVGSFKD